MATMISDVALDSVVSFSEGYWNVCNDAFDRDVHTASDMQRLQKGNCFTLSEFLCERLIKQPEVVASGVCIEVLPSRRNYHASSWALTGHPWRAARFDLLEENPISLQGMEEALVQLANTPTNVLYLTTAESEVENSPCIQQSVRQRYQWPLVGDAHEAIFLNTPLGIQTLHALAEAGGIRQLLDAKAREQIVPTLPLS